MYPMFSSRWRDLFSYGQVRTELRTRLPLRPYVSARFVGDTRGTIGVTNPQYLSESSVILGFGVTTRPWHGVTGWMEAGSAVSYLRRQMLPDYRGGVSFFRAAGNGLRGESAGWFAEATADGVFVSRFGDDFLVYGQTRVGYSSGPGWLRTQAYWNTNVIFDVRRQSWANVFESGPGVRFAARPLPESMHATFDVLRGSYLISSGGRKPGFNDLRAGVWYAFSY
jgi:hypothetical protein